MLWCTMFAFEVWHSVLEFKLYMHRFLHALDGLNDLSSLAFPKYNQYDAFVKPVQAVLKEKGVKIQYNTLVKDVEMEMTPQGNIVKGLITEQDGNEVTIS
jgi:oleate hydratase